MAPAPALTLILVLEYAYEYALSSADVLSATILDSLGRLRFMKSATLSVAMRWLVE